MSGQPENDYTPLTVQQIEDFVEEVIEANAVWPDPLSSQVSAVMDVVREAMAQAWDEGRAAERRDWEFTFDLSTPDEDRQPLPNPYLAGGA